MEQCFDVPDDALLDAFSTVVTTSKLHAMELADHSHNICPDCKCTMDTRGTDYQCGQCGYTTTNETIGEPDREASGGRIRITTGVNKGRYRNINNDYSRTQIKNIYDQLRQLQLHYVGAKISLDVLGSVAERYNAIQRLIKSTDAVDGGKQKFVRRGDIKNEILAALIYFECIRQNNPRKRPDIATFMNLHVQGFSRGEDTLRDLAANGFFDMPSCDHIVGYTERYFEALRIECPRYDAFVIGCTRRSTERNIGVSSQISSRVAGAIYIVIVQCKLATTVAELERAADNTKKNTFMKFYKAVMDNMSEFQDLFTALHGTLAAQSA